MPPGIDYYYVNPRLFLADEGCTVSALFHNILCAGSSICTIDADGSVKENVGYFYAGNFDRLAAMTVKRRKRSYPPFTFEPFFFHSCLRLFYRKRESSQVPSHAPYHKRLAMVNVFCYDVS